jgi:hypothetical protein
VKPLTASDNRFRRPTAFAQSRHVAVIHGQFGKSPFDRECVVGQGGLEFSTKPLSAASSEPEENRARLWRFFLASEVPEGRGFLGDRPNNHSDNQRFRL